MPLNDKLFFPKEIVCPICEKSFVRYTLRKSSFSIAKRDIDYRPIYIGAINPRLYAICVCPHCYFAGEDKYFCPSMKDDDLRRKALFASHKAQWEAKSRVKAAGSGQQIWKDLASEKLKEITPEEIAILKRITPLLQKVVSKFTCREKPINEQQKDGDTELAIRSYELAAICYKARRANHRILGYTYLSGAWAARDAREHSHDHAQRQEFLEFELAFMREAVNFLTITNKATSIDDTYMPDGTKILKENMPQSRIFEVMYILAGAHRILEEVEDSNKYLEQIIYGGSGAQGICLWFVQQARDLRQSDQVGPIEVGDPITDELPPGESEEGDDNEDEDEDEPDEGKKGWFF